MTHQTQPLVAAPRPNRPIPDTTGQVKTKARRAAGRTTLMLTFSPSEASAMRELCQALRFANGKLPSMALVARRSLEVYRAWTDEVLRGPAGPEGERRALTRLASFGAQKRVAA